MHCAKKDDRAGKGGKKYRNRNKYNTLCKVCLVYHEKFHCKFRSFGQFIWKAFVSIEVKGMDFKCFKC